MAQVVIQSASRNGDAITVVGTGDGVSVQAQVWLSHLQTLPTPLAKRTYIAQQLAAQVPAVIDLSSQFTGAPITV